ncbi:hypothetical protein ACPEEZ_01665 [Frigoribacterium sp. 2-23]|uniref:hypothetical protein n=1 Tax=Frigoribacterium sp. 2-23 TaxID=3415006 RepID=UPI003C7045F9
MFQIPELVRRADVMRAGGDERALLRDRDAGRLTAVGPGVYVDAAVFSRARPAERHAIAVHAIVPRLGTDVLVSHESALALRAFPLLGDWPRVVHVIDLHRTRARTDTWLVRHVEPRDGVGQVEDVGGLRTVGVARAVFDVIRARELRDAVIILDHALHSGSLDVADLSALVDAAVGVRGCRRARTALELADARAESPGESLSRVGMLANRLPPPVLQQAFVREGRGVDRVDFWWPDQGVIGEFDGENKYRDDGFRQGRTPEQVLLDEKYREDRLRARAEVRTLVRWNWADALAVRPMLLKLARAGIRPAGISPKHP